MTTASIADQDLTIIAGLTEELARLRGKGSAGVMPQLDHEDSGEHAHGGGGDAAEEEDDAAEEALVRMQTEMQAAKDFAEQSDRAALRAQMDRGSEEREALNLYLEELRAREDETGDAMRSVEFATDVDELAHHQREQLDGGTDGKIDPMKIIASGRVSDAETMDALLEVQRLDEAIESTEKKQQDAQQAAASTFLTEAAAGGAAALDAPPSASASPRSAKLPRPPTYDALGASLTALNSEIGRLQGKGFDEGAAAQSRSEAASETTSAASDERFAVGGRRRLGGKWLSIADEERIDALLVDSAHDDADEDDDWCPFGEGYKPAQEIAERLAAIEQQLDELTSVRSLSGDYNLQPEPLAPPVAHGDLGAMRLERAEKEALGHIRERLAALHSTPNTAPPSSEREAQLLGELLATARHEAERAVDSRPPSARPLSARTTASVQVLHLDPEHGGAHEHAKGGPNGLRNHLDPEHGGAHEHAKGGPNGLRKPKAGGALEVPDLE